jgi:homoserine kinase type II
MTSQVPPTSPDSAPAQRTGRAARLRGPDIAIVLSHYDIGVIERIREYRRGSRRAPKLRITAAGGEFLLKRRAPGRDDVRRVAYAHALQRRLAEQDYPVARLVPTRGGSTLVERKARVYELFEFIEGERDDRSPAAAGEAGRRLGELHRHLEDRTDADAPTSPSFHDAPGLESAIRQIPSVIAAADPDHRAGDLERRCAFLIAAYRDAARRVEAEGYRDWPRTTLHGDWHPGNLLYRDGTVVGVLDFDSARLETRAADVANAALQFSLRTTDGDPAEWPHRLDVERIRALVRGYDETAREPLRHEERNALPWLMIEALVLESTVPIAATGYFAHLPGAVFLELVERTVAWLQPRSRRLLELLSKPTED